MTELYSAVTRKPTRNYSNTKLPPSPILESLVSIDEIESEKEQKPSIIDVGILEQDQDNNTESKDESFQSDSNDLKKRQEELNSIFNNSYRQSDDGKKREDSKRRTSEFAFGARQSQNQLPLYKTTKYPQKGSRT